MGYRGEDLDLKTLPQANAGDAPAERRAQPANRTTIWVDDLVLECCNYAFDIALAHRAAEVRLEHLIYALTRIDSAAEALEARGLRVAALRREAAAFVATEIPASAAKSAPRRSEALEDALRLAASTSYRRQAAVSIDDLVSVLLDADLDLPALQRARSLAARTSSATLETFTPDPLRDRLRAPFFATDRETPRAPELASLATAQQSYTQAARIDALEQQIRALGTDLANERKVISGALHDLQREIMAHRDEQRSEMSRLGGVSQEKLQLVIGDRLQGIEQAVATIRSASTLDLGGFSERLAGIERTLGTEFSSARAALADLAAKPAPQVDLGPLTQRLDLIEEAVLSQETLNRVGALETAVSNLGAALGSERDRAIGAHNQLAGDLQTVAAQLGQQTNDIATVVGTPLHDRLANMSITLDNHHAGTTDGLMDAQRRLTALDEALQTHIGRTENAESVAAQEFSTIHDEVAKIAAASSESFTEVHDALGKINTNQHTLAAALAAQGRDAAQALAALSARIDGLEKATAKPVAMLETLSGTTERMHKLMVEKYFRRNRFWYWLFGTDDWIAASWPSQTARIAEELDLLKRH